MTPRARQSLTIDDWLRLKEPHHFELIDGELVEKSATDEPHSNAQTGVATELGVAFNRRGGGSGGHPGGWWIRTELDIRLGDNVFRPDVCGFRRDRVPELPRAFPCPIRPDWICEVISDSNARNDTVKKLRRYHQAGVPHYWLVDPRNETLVVYRHTPDGYLTVLAAEKGELVRAEPLAAIELRVGLLFGEDPDDPPAPPSP
jgi:Uma2 family endonuclease